MNKKNPKTKYLSSHMILIISASHSSYSSFLQSKQQEKETKEQRNKSHATKWKLGKFFSQSCIEVLCKFIIEKLKAKCKYLLFLRDICLRLSIIGCSIGSYQSLNPVRKKTNKMVEEGTKKPDPNNLQLDEV